jgi:hypothetical protein
MSQQRRKKYTYFLQLLLVVFIVLSGIRCDSILPEDFKTKEYTIAGIDNQACTMLLDTTGTNIYARTLASLKTIVDSAALANGSENQVILQKFSALVDSLPQLVEGSLMITYYATDQKNSYAVLKVLSGQAKDLYIYTSLFYNANNVNEYITVRLLKSDTTEVSYSNDMPGETVSGGTQTIIVASDERIVPTIRSRDIVHVDEGVYIVRFTMSDPSTIGKFKIALLP